MEPASRLNGLVLSRGPARSDMSTEAWIMAPGQKMRPHSKCSHAWQAAASVLHCHAARKGTGPCFRPTVFSRNRSSRRKMDQSPANRSSVAIGPWRPAEEESHANPVVRRVAVDRRGFRGAGRDAGEGCRRRLAATGVARGTARRADPDRRGALSAGFCVEPQGYGRQSDHHRGRRARPAAGVRGRIGRLAPEPLRLPHAAEHRRPRAEPQRDQRGRRRRAGCARPPYRAGEPADQRRRAGRQLRCDQAFGRG